MLTTIPAGGYTEIGAVDVVPDTFTTTMNLAEFQRNIRPFVCKAGGDAAVAKANGLGVYIKASILKISPSAAALPEAPASPTPLGCQYDMQCKGDRICVAGQCKSP